MERSVSELLGKILSSVDVNREQDEIVFTCQDGEKYVMSHDQDCCESVTIEDICGNIDDLIGSPILMSDEATSDKKLDGSEPNVYDSFTWTFYKFSTIKGYVTIRWFGESNGYYSESVSFEKLSERVRW